MEEKKNYMILKYVQHYIDHVISIFSLLSRLSLSLLTKSLNILETHTQSFKYFLSLVVEKLISILIQPQRWLDWSALSLE